MTSAGRLKVGIGLVAGIAVLCVVGPFLRDPVPSDPVHAALLPPLTRVTVLSLDDRSSVVAPRVLRSERDVVVAGAGRETRLDAGRIVGERGYRFWLGSDRFGHDVLLQLMTGGRISLAIAVLALVLAPTVGGAIGVAAASSAPWVDGLLMRLVDALLAFPVLFLMILAAAVTRPDPALLVLLLGLTSWMGVARLVRGQLLSLRRRPFIAAATASGSTPLRIATWHYAPNLAGPVSQDAALRVGDLVLAEASLSYLGLGVPPSVATWGSMVAQGHRMMPAAWWLVVLPGVAISALVIGFALIGDGLQHRGEPGT
jgi:peptide/nickel transport system permease protein